MTDEQFQVLAGLLMEIRDGIALLVGALVPPPAPETDECQHPEDARVSIATPAKPDHWICNVCRFEHGG